MSEFFSNLSMQALNREDDTVQLNFRHLRELCDSIKNLLRGEKALMYDKSPGTFNEYSPPEFEKIKDKYRKIEEEVVENIISGRQLSFPRDTSYMSFPNTPQEIAEHARIRDEANRRTLLAMQPYDEEFSAAEGRRELLDAIKKADDDFASAVTSNLLEVEANKIKIDDNSNVDEVNIAILPRVDAAQNITTKRRGKKASPPPLSDIIASSPDGKLRVRRSKPIRRAKKGYRSLIYAI